jgi:hypothetical protein
MVSKREKIVQQIATALGRISVANGYDTELGSNVERFDHEGQRLGKLPAALLLVGSESFSDGDIQSELRCSLNLQVEVICDPPSDGWTSSSDAWADRYLRDVHRALMADPFWGGDAIDTKLKGYERAVDEVGRWGFVLGFETYYSCGLEDPGA